MDMENEPDIELFGIPTLELGRYNCTFIGHSFIKRLDKWLTSNKNQFGMGLNVEEVNLNFQVGYTIPHLYSHIQSNSSLILDSEFVVIDIGGNDLSDDACDELILCEMLMALVRHIRSLNAKCIITVLQLLHRKHLNKPVICQLLRQRSGACCAPNAIDCYNKQVDGVNKLLKLKLPLMNNVFYWCHKSLWSHRKFSELYDSDGIHLSPAGMRKYARSVRGAVIQSMKHLFR